MIHSTKIGRCDFRFFCVECYGPMLWAQFCSDVNKNWRMSSKMNVLSDSIAHIVQQQPSVDICRNV